MHSGRWMIYGANGFTGVLIAEAAVRRGGQPLLAGRSAERLASLAGRLNLGMAAFDLQDETGLCKTMEDIDLVLNVAGPFIHTAMPIVSACLKTGTSYLDICGEVMVLEELFTLDQQAREVEIAVIPGVGFNVLASDCLALYVAEQVENPTHLEIATKWFTDGMSPGSTRTMNEGFPVGILGRRNGKLVRINPRHFRRRQAFIDREYAILPVTIGDLVTAYKTTHIPDITTYGAFSDQAEKSYSLMEPFLRRLYSLEFIRRIANRQVEKSALRSHDQLHGENNSQVWVSARNEDGSESQAWLETVDSYLFTAEAAVRCVERLLSEHRMGVTTPSLAFGADFVLEIPGTKRADSLRY